MKHSLLALALLVAATGGACASSKSLPPCSSADGKTTLTYANFGQGFMSSNCVSCHSEYGTLSNVKSNAGDIVSEAGTGTSMPKGTGNVSSADRSKLTEWLACGGN